MRTVRRTRARRKNGAWPASKIGPRRLQAEREIDNLVFAETAKIEFEVARKKKQLRAAEKEIERLARENRALRIFVPTRTPRRVA
jgi:hypothetical protein